MRRPRGVPRVSISPWRALTAFDRLLDTYVGYFGALTCVAWSADGRFVFVSAPQSPVVGC